MNIDIPVITRTLDPPAGYVPDDSVIGYDEKTLLDKAFITDSLNPETFTIIDTIDDGNCLIDALLLSTSVYYRSLKRRDRQPKCLKFRNEEFIKLVPRPVLSPATFAQYPEAKKEYDATIALIKSSEFLEDTHIQLFLNFYKINVIIFNDIQITFNFREIGKIPRMSVIYADSNENNGYSFIFLYNHGQEFNNYPERPVVYTTDDYGIPMHFLKANHYSAVRYKKTFSMEYHMAKRIYDETFPIYQKQNIDNFPRLREIIAALPKFTLGDTVKYIGKKHGTKYNGEIFTIKSMSPIKIIAMIRSEDEITVLETEIEKMKF
jgi:hypothetical protein